MHCILPVVFVCSAFILNRQIVQFSAEEINNVFHNVFIAIPTHWSRRQDIAQCQTSTTYNTVHLQINYKFNTHFFKSLKSALLGVYMRCLWNSVSEITERIATRLSSLSGHPPTGESKYHRGGRRSQCTSGTTWSSTISWRTTQSYYRIFRSVSSCSRTAEQ